MTNIRSVTAMNDPEGRAILRWRAIEHASVDFRKAWKRSNGQTLTTFPPMSEAEADRARSYAYNWSFLNDRADRVQAYRAEVAAINRAERP